MKYKMGAIPSPVDPRDYVLPSGVSGAETLPDEWWPNKISVHDQGQINSCVGHALAAGYEQQGCPAMAFGHIYGNRNYTDWLGEGLIVRDALKTIQKDGVPTLESYPHDKEVQEIIDIFKQYAPDVADEAAEFKIGNYYRLTSGEECRRAMHDGYFVLFSLYLFEQFADVTEENPVMPIPDPNGEMIPLGGHSTASYGWDKRGCRSINSWGEAWGEDGCFYIPDEAFTWSDKNGFPIPLVEAWAIEIGKAPDKQESGWYKQDGKWRYKNEDGKDCTGWLKDNQKWYFLDKDGYMVTGWVEVDDEWYYLAGDGHMLTGWVKDGKYWYYLAADGSMKTGWVTVKDKTYWLNTERYDGIPRGACLITDESGAVV